MTRRGLVAIAAAALLLTGCTAAGVTDPGGPGGDGASEPTPSPEYAAVPLVPLTHPDVLAYCPELPAEHLAVAAAEVVDVLRCTTELGLDGAASIERVDRLATDPAVLLEAYAADDAERPEDQVCTLDFADPLILWLTLANGETIAVRAPADQCGKPQQTAADALASAVFVRVLEQPMG